MTIDAILSILQQHSSHPSEIAIIPNTIPPGLSLPPNQLVAIGYLLQTHPELYFDYLACITAIDNGPTAGTVDAIYQLYTIPYNQSLMLKVTVPRDHPNCNIPSVSGIWQAANWHEREAYDLVGIHFEGHPDLRRILLPADWTGHPLRTDYTPDPMYHGIAVD